jgi:F-type H+-transporting ATPase subunit b
MLIDWFTVGAQVLNFLVLVWLMKRYLYRPILDAIDDREKHIATALADADARKAEARKERDELARRQDDFERQRATLMSQAAQEAEAERRRLIDEAHRAAAAAREQQQQALRNEAQQLEQELAQRTQDEVFAIARKVLGDLASASLEERAVAAFELRLRTADEKLKTSMGHALERAEGPGLVRSAFDLPIEQRARLQAVVDEVFARHVVLRFERAPGLVGGIELTVNGQKLAWSIAGYLASLQRHIGDFVASRSVSTESRR